ncbi:monoglyceride lipase-like [Amblyraja radiata]|uniref:monoglyceride lipase-like n=1 Tax=Amblyraja radiata TaxID=386614 RepID=UPI00140382E3|nr:monoglyceride lipase-like [Amblyraja radiata]
MGGGWCCKSPKKNRVSPHGLIYKNFPHFVNKDGTYLFCRYWEPITTPRAMMMILHGGGEHSGCFKNITPIFTNLSMFVFSHDYIGHGHSEGARLSVPEFGNYIRDCIQHIDLMRERYPTLPLYILSNSMGALIAINVLIQKPENIAGMIFIAPLVQMNPESATPFKMFCAKVMYHLMPNFVLGHLDPQWLSSSPEEVQKMVDDPLHSLGPYRMRFTVQVLEAVAKVKAFLPLIEIPLLIAHGEFDKLCDINGSILLYTSVSSKDKTMKIFKDAFAQLHNEAPSITRELQVLIRKWLIQRLPPMAE